MRLAFFVLLLVNLILFFWGQGYLGEQATGREPERQQRQIEPEKLRIVTAATQSVPVADTMPVCKRLEWLVAAEVAAIKEAVTALPGWEINQLSRPELPVHWVVVPELSSRALAEKKKTELRQLGITESEIVEHATLGPFTVSLGVFRGQTLAEEFMQTLMRKGVRSARLVKRELPAEKFALELNAPVDALNRKLPEWMAPLVGVNLTECAKP